MIILENNQIRLQHIRFPDMLKIAFISLYTEQSFAEVILASQSQTNHAQVFKIYTCNKYTCVCQKLPKAYLQKKVKTKAWGTSKYIYQQDEKFYRSN